MKKKLPILKSEHLELRTYDESDMDKMVALLCNEEIKKTYMIPDFDHREQAEAMFYKIKDYSESEEHFEYGIVLNGELIGFVNDCKIEGGMVELGYVISPRQKGNGYATEALQCAIKELFRRGYTTVRTGYFESNEASRCVMQKCGMKQVDFVTYEEYQGRRQKVLYCEISRED